MHGSDFTSPGSIPYLDVTREEDIGTRGDPFVSSFPHESRRKERVYFLFLSIGRSTFSRIVAPSVNGNSINVRLIYYQCVHGKGKCWTRKKGDDISEEGNGVCTRDFFASISLSFSLPPNMCCWESKLLLLKTLIVT